MENIKSRFAMYIAFLVAIALCFSATIVADEHPDMRMVEEGKALSLDRKKGNCAACHWIAGVESPGNFGPALVGMKIRYPNKAELRQLIWDITAVRPEVAMPPFGKHGILSDEDIDKITEYISTL